MIRSIAFSAGLMLHSHLQAWWMGRIKRYSTTQTFVDNMSFYVSTVLHFDRCLVFYKDILINE